MLESCRTRGTLRSLVWPVTQVSARVLLPVLLAGLPADAATGTATASFGTPEGALVIVRADIEDAAQNLAASAADVLIDGVATSQALVFPGRPLESLVGPLTAGRHTVALRPSSSWPWPASRHMVSARVEIVAPSGADYDLLRWAPRLGLRADTIGTQSDLPLLLYAERPQGDERRLRYSLIFSNEDGGTPVRALIARWGRTTDIEWACEVSLGPDGRPREWSFQGPEHDTRQVVPPPASPVLVVASLNNIFLASGASAASIRMLPRLLDLHAATRESVMDSEPWTYDVMARELAAEHKLDAGAGEDPQTVADPRAYVYVEARLALRQAAAAAWIESDAGDWRSSHHGRKTLAIERDGWVRTAVELGAGEPTRVAWECLSSTEGPSSGAGCEIEVTRVFRLDARFRPGANRITGATLRLRPGELGTLPVAR
jgi:hypothetical protein